jgi:hypothetical protein
MGPSSSREESSQICTSSYASRFDGHPSLPLERQPVGALKFTRRQAKGIQQFFGYAADLYNVARELSDSTPYNFNSSVCVLFGHYIGGRSPREGFGDGPGLLRDLFFSQPDFELCARLFQNPQ